MDIPLIYYINNIQIFPYRQEKKKKKKVCLTTVKFLLI